MLTGQDCCQSQDEVNLLGGEVGNYEGHLNSVVLMGFDNKVMSSSNTYVSKPKLPISQETSRHFVAN